MSNPWDETLQRRYGTKLAPAKPLATASGDDKTDLEASIRTAEQQRQQDITFACELAGKPQRRQPPSSPTGTSLSDVLAALAGTTATKPSERPTPEQRHQSRLARMRG